MRAGSSPRICDSAAVIDPFLGNVTTLLRHHICVCVPIEQHMSSPVQPNDNNSPVTPRDRVWSSVVDESKTEFTVSDIKSRLYQDGYDEIPSEETIKRVLRSMTELNVLRHKKGSPYYDKQTDFKQL
ncbi:uncharacterized protein HQ_2095C [Haloquadratum walsbyi DSM 16790]|uniref:Uncharacterized protein n=2 Tax=Haloquadratum walsbyi TaxID=293091 RepID=J7RFV0_HALWD|nr:uncharacterized protein HQ_2095C [Haloquadratum walsbyi DSM 16790]